MGLKKEKYKNEEEKECNFQKSNQMTSRHVIPFHYEILLGNCKQNV